MRFAILTAEDIKITVSWDTLKKQRPMFWQNELSPPSGYPGSQTAVLPNH